MAWLALPGAAGAAPCGRTITANVVAMDQPIMFNRLGAQNINGMVFALRRDVINIDSGMPLTAGGLAVPGRVQLRPDKRPRPLVLRVAEGDCLTVNFHNLLAPLANPFNAPIPGFGLPPFNLIIDEQVADRFASFHAQGMQLQATGGIANDGSDVGANPAGSSGIVAPGASITYRLYAEKSGTYLAQSYGATFGSEGTQGNGANGLFGAVNVEPSSKTAGRYTRFYRSQLTEEEMRLAADANNNGLIDPGEKTPAGQPIINYEKVYPGTPWTPAGCAPTDVWCKEGKAGLPIINMLASNELVHSDINAMIVGPNPDGTFDTSTFPLENVGKRNPALPNRLEAFREFTVIFHDEVAAAQVFPAWYNHPVLGYVLHPVRDSFMINYGSGGVGSEIISNRLGVGPMHDCLTCAYEEFFLTSYAVGDPAMVVDVPANFGLEALAPGATPPPGTTGRKATEAFYPDDPSNVHHSYTNDRTVFHNLSVGREQHIYHLHNHQWLYNPNDDNSNYLDAQSIGPGSGYTYEINYGGSGNRNKSAGDAIFHCHFYPHFAQGMWELWRNHDVYETGTILEKTATAPGGLFHANPFDLLHGRPAEAPPGLLPAPPVGARTRGLPDGEIAAGTPIPALVPLPGKPMPVMPGRVYVVEKKEGATVLGSKAFVDRTDTYLAAGPGVHSNLVGKIKNPGYPFWIAGIEDTVGQRPPTPVLDMDPAAGGWDGGLPRHSLDGIAAAGPGSFASTATARDLSKVVLKAKGVFYPEDGTDVEKAVMDFHGLVRNHPSYALKLDGTQPAGDFITNGYRDTTIGNPAAAPQPGSPFHEPCIDDAGKRLIRAGNAPAGAPLFGNFFGSSGLSVTGSSVFNATTPRVYKGANIQYDAILNKAGYHYPQQRIVALWQDAEPTINKVKPGEPLVMRINTFDCASYQHTNLAPEFFEMDDYQVRTPTDIIGQHIHLPKWDLTTTDGSGNGWNYEDGTLSPGAVRERIHAINDGSQALGTGSGSLTLPGTLVAKKHPFFPLTGPGGVDWSGARVTLQRWFADPLVNVEGQDRGLGIIFTHDHYGPSTFQQVGLYSAVLTEPAGSVWRHNETGQQLGCRFPGDAGCRADGGPTSWQAAILPPPEGGEAFREFYFQFTDFQHAYEKGVYVGANQWGAPMPGPKACPTCLPNTDLAPVLGPADRANTFRYAINPPGRTQIAPVFPDLVLEAASLGAPCLVRPCPEAISGQDPGMMVVNYRNEPVGLRVYDPNKLGPDGKPGAQAAGIAGDLAFALSTKLVNKAGTVTPIVRAIPEMNKKDCFGASAECLNFFTQPLNRPTAVDKNDPFTPMPRVYTGDIVRIKAQAGGDEEEHNVTVHGMKWLQAGSAHGRAPNSGWRNGQAAGISEQFTFRVPMFAAPMQVKTPESARDYAWSVDASQDGWWSGMWGILRAYDKLRVDNPLTVGVNEADLFALPGTPNPPAQSIENRRSFNGVCPANPTTGATLTPRPYNIVAVLANDVLPNPGVAITPSASTLIPGTTLTLNQMHSGGPLNGNGTLVYNPRTTVNGHSGPIHDPTAILYLHVTDLKPATPAAAASNACKDSGGGPGVTNPTCPVVFKNDHKPEPLILRANAGDCLEVTLYSRLPQNMPDLPTFSLLQGVVKRDRFNPLGSTTFNNNLIRPSGHAGLHPQLVMTDVTQDDGTNVGQNIVQTVPPVDPVTKARPPKMLYRWYAGDLTAVKSANRINLVATPVEFGGSGLIPADKIKQGQKSMVGGLVILPPGATWTEGSGRGPDLTNPGHQAATVTVPGKIFRDFMVVMTKDIDHRYADGFPVEHVNGEGLGIPEDSQDSSGMALNYGIEPLWFRFGKKPNAPFGHAAGNGFGDVGNAHLAYSNFLPGVGGDPATPVFTASAGQEVRLHFAVPHSASRGSTLQIHGHVWQRDPYICPGEARLTLSGACDMTTLTLFGPMPSVGSKALGNNPFGFAQGAQDSLTPYTHFDFLLPKAGGVDSVTGDYLFRDQAGSGITSGLWGILRVQ
ncbi:MAG: hypothetical protein AAB225_09650 [Acidobacteriota bacterium]